MTAYRFMLGLIIILGVMAYVGKHSPYKTWMPYVGFALGFGYCAVFAYGGKR